jgi:hypothetical protein
MANSVFVSPGVYTSEKDLTFVTRQVGVTTLGLVGETTQGPAFNPVFVTDYDEFKTFFGGLNSTKIVDNGAPKYELPYIAKSYLSESNQLFVTRVLGYSGYDAGKCWGITLDAALDTSTTGTSIATTSISGTFFTYTATSGGTLTAITTTEGWVQTLYDNGDLDSALANVPIQDIGDTGGTTAIVWNKPSETGNSFSGVSFNYTVTATGTTGGGLLTGATSASTITYYSGTSYSDVENKIVATLRSRGSYDGDEVLNFEVTGTTDATIDGSVTTAQESPLGVFRLSAMSQTQGAMTYDVSFDSTKKNYITRVLGRTQSDGKTALFVEEVYKNMLDNYITDGKVRGINLSLVNYAAKFDDYKVEYAPAVTPYLVSEVRGSNIIRLFRLWTISDGNSANYQIKISIENIKPDDKEFDVVVRNYADTDAKPVKLERFTRCNMDPASDNFVARRIGTLDGEYASKSNYILVELDEDSDSSDAFPAGFVGYEQRDSDDNGNSGVLDPSIRYKQTYGTYENKRKFYLGLSDTVGIDQDFFDYKGKPDSTETTIWTGLTQGFHMDSGATACTIDGISEAIDLTGGTYEPTYTFAVGNAEFRTDAGIVGTDYENIRARKFTFAPAGGFDGWDIYRTRRTNTDTYAISGTKGLAGGPDGTQNFAALALTNGENGITSDYYAYLEGILTFNNPESVNINVFATPGIDTFDNSNLIEASIDMVEEDRADSLYIVTTPDTDSAGDVLDVEDVVSQLEDEFDSNYTCTYWPWVQINDAENNVYMWVPPTRDVVRNIARTDNIAYPWFAAAGINRGDVDCIKARKKLTLEERDDLYEGRINPIATFASDGVKIWGNKTLQVADTALNRINVRRLLLQARKLISAVAIRLLFEQNDDIVRNQFLSLVNPILDGIRAERGITDFRVTVDSSPESIDRNELIGKIYLKPTRALEFIIVEFNIMPTGASFEDI